MSRCGELLQKSQQSIQTQSANERQLEVLSFDVQRYQKSKYIFYVTKNVQLLRWSLFKLNSSLKIYEKKILKNLYIFLGLPY